MAPSQQVSYLDRVVLEIIETERVYVQDLRMIVEDYLAHIIDQTDLSIRPEQVCALFGNIEDIYEFNSELLQELDQCRLDPVAVARCFVLKSEYFGIYTQYCTNYPRSVLVLTEIMRDKTLAMFFRQRQQVLNTPLPLGSYLLKPVQRVLKYHLLLQEIRRHWTGAEGGDVVEEAILSMTAVAFFINEMKRRHETSVRVQEVQSLLLNWKGRDLTTFGDLVLEGTFKMCRVKNERTLFLFQRVLLITKRRGEQYVYKNHISCSTLMLIENARDSLSFSVTHYKRPKQPHTVQARSVEEKQLWAHHVKRIILENHQAVIPQKAKEAILKRDPISRFRYSPKDRLKTCLHHTVKGLVSEKNDFRGTDLKPSPGSGPAESRETQEPDLDQDLEQDPPLHQDQKSPPTEELKTLDQDQDQGQDQVQDPGQDQEVDLDSRTLSSESESEENHEKSQRIVPDSGPASPTRSTEPAVHFSGPDPVLGDDVMFKTFKQRRDSTLSQKDQLLIEKIRTYYETQIQTETRTRAQRRDSLNQIPPGLVQTSVSRLNCETHSNMETTETSQDPLKTIQTKPSSEPEHDSLKTNTATSLVKGQDFSRTLETSTDTESSLDPGHMDRDQSGSEEDFKSSSEMIKIWQELDQQKQTRARSRDRAASYSADDEEELNQNKVQVLARRYSQHLKTTTPRTSRTSRTRGTRGTTRTTRTTNPSRARPRGDQVQSLVCVSEEDCSGRAHLSLQPRGVSPEQRFDWPDVQRLRSKYSLHQESVDPQLYHTGYNGFFVAAETNQDDNPWHKVIVLEKKMELNQDLDQKLEKNLTEKSLVAQSSLESNAEQKSLTIEANNKICVTETSVKAEPKTEQTLSLEEKSNVTEKKADAQSLHKLENQQCPKTVQSNNAKDTNLNPVLGFNGNLENEQKPSLMSELRKKFDPEPKNSFIKEKRLEMERKLTNKKSVTEPSFNDTKSQETKEKSKSLSEVNVEETKMNSDQTVKVIKKAFETETKEKLKEKSQETEKPVTNLDKTLETDRNKQTSQKTFYVTQSFSETEQKFNSDKFITKAAYSKINKEKMTTEKRQKFTKKTFETVAKEIFNVKEKYQETEQNKIEKMETNKKFNTEVVEETMTENVMENTFVPENKSFFDIKEMFYVKKLDSKHFTDVAGFGVKLQETMQNKQTLEENFNFMQIYQETDLKCEQNSEYNKFKTTHNFEDSKSNVAETTEERQMVKDKTKKFIPEQNMSFSDVKERFDVRKLAKNLERTLQNEQKLNENSNVATGQEPEKKRIQKSESEKFYPKFVADSEINNSEIKTAEATTEKQPKPEQISIKLDSDEDQVLVQIRSPTSREKLCIWAVSERRRVYQTPDEHCKQTEKQSRDSNKDAQKQKVVKNLKQRFQSLN